MPPTRATALRGSFTNREIKAKSPENAVFSGLFNGADGRIRTGDLILTKDALYLLSYISASVIAERKNYYITDQEKKQ